MQTLNCTSGGPLFSDASAVFDLAADVDHSLPGMIDCGETRRLSHSRFARSGFLFILPFEIGGAIGPRFFSTVPSTRTLAFGIFNILAALSVSALLGRFGFKSLAPAGIWIQWSGCRQRYLSRSAIRADRAIFYVGTCAPSQCLRRTTNRIHAEPRKASARAAPTT